MAQTPAAASRRARVFLQGRTAQAATSSSRLISAQSVSSSANSGIQQARAQHQALVSAQAVSLTTPWTPVGPLQVQTQSYGLITGRVTAVSIDPSDTTGNTVVIGTSGGGVWKSTNAAGPAASVSFRPLNDTLAVFSPNASSPVIPSLSIGAVSVQPGGTGVILAGTGDPNDASDSYYGEGILRSIDGGNTWSLIQTTTGGFSFAGEGIAAFTWSTTNPNLVVAAVSSAAEAATVGASKAPGVRGLYYSLDAGATWNIANAIQDGSTVVQNRSTSYASFRGNAATAVVWNPVRKKFYAAIRAHGYYESNDGANWSRMTNQPGAGLTTANCPARTGDYGLQSCPIFRGALAVQPVSGDLFALTVDYSNADQGLYQDTCNKTTTACANTTPTWSNKLDATPLEDNGAIDQGDYNLTLAAIPAATALNLNDTILFAGATDLYRCTLTGGCTLRNTTNTTTGCAAPAGVAPAQHAIDWQINTADTATPRIFLGNDGGLWRSLDGVRQQAAVCSPDDATHFDNLNATLGSLAEVVSFASHPSDPNTLLVALGANGSAATTDAKSWTQLNAGESGTVAIDQANGSNWLLQSGAGVQLHVCTKGSNCTAADFAGPAAIGPAQISGDESLIDAPALLDPALSTNVLIGTCRIWRGPAVGGSLWSATNAISPFLAGPLDTACNNSDGMIRSLAAGGPAMLTGVSQTSGSPVLYAGLAGTADGGTALGGRIFRTTAANIATAAWTDLSISPVTNDANGFNPAGFDISSIATDPNDATGRTVYATVMGFGTPHVYRSIDAGTTWTNISANLPNAPANSVVVDPANAKVVYAALDTGVYVAQDVTTCAITNCWSVLGTALPNAPVLTLVASRGFAAPGNSTNGVLRAGTYGRGIWQTPLLSAGTIALPAATFSPASITFSPQNVGTTSTAQTVTLANTGNTSLIIGAITASAGFAETDTCANTTIALNATCTLTITYAPTTAGAITGSIQIAANLPGGYASLTVNGTGNGMPNITLAPKALTFDTTAVSSTSAAQIITVTNTGTGAATLAAPTATADFNISSTTCSTTLAINGTCTIAVTFAPSQSGARTGTLMLADNVLTHTVTLNGTGQGTPAVSLSPASFTFANTRVGNSSGSSILTATVANTGTANLTIASITTTGDFVIYFNTCNASLVLSPGSSCQVLAYFAPSTLGVRTGALTIVDTLGTHSIPLSGTGVDQPVKVSFAPSSLAFPATPVNTVSAAQTIAVTSTGSYYTSFHTPVVLGDFGITSNTCYPNVPAGGCMLTVVFSPTTVGPQSGSITLADDLATYTIPLAGTSIGTANVGLSATSINFGTVAVRGTSAAQTVTVTNSGTAGIALQTPVLTGDFALITNTCGATLDAGKTCILSLVFTPTLDGARSGTLTLQDANSIHTVALSGNGHGTAAITLAPAALDFGSIAVHATSAAASVTVSNTGTAAASLAAPIVTGDFSLATNTCTASLAAGANCTLGIVFTPTIPGIRSGTLALADSAANHSVALNGTGTAGILLLAPSSLSFFDTTINSNSAQQAVTLTNSGTGSLNLSSVAASGDFVVSNGCPASLAAGKSCSVGVTFHPSAVGARTGAITVLSDSGGVIGASSTVALSGNGSGSFHLVLLPAAADFGTQLLNTTSAATNITLSNTGNVSGAISGIAIVGTDFAIKANTCGATLAPNAGCTVSVVFTPSVLGARSAQLNINSDSSTQTVPLTGTGTSPATDALSPLTLTFGATQVNTTSTSQNITLTNSGDVALTLVAAQVLTGDFAAVNNCGPTVAAHSTCAITVVFAPKTPGTRTGTLQISDVLHVQTVALTGSAFAGPGVSLTPGNLTFANTGVGVAGAGQTLTLTNNGGVSLQLSTITTTGDFGIVAGTNTCFTTTALAVNANCTLQIAFLPTAAGQRTGQLSITSNAPTQTAQLSGTGVDFSLVTNGASSVTISNGGSAAFPLLLRPSVTTSDPVKYACTGAPANARCTITSQYSDLSAIGTVTVTVLTGTTALTRSGMVTAIGALLPAFLFMPWIKRRARRSALCAVLLLAMTMFFNGCGSGRKLPEPGDGTTTGTGGGTTTPTTPTGTYTITASATAAGVTHSVPLTLIVK